MNWILKDRLFIDNIGHEMMFFVEKFTSKGKERGTQQYLWNGQNLHCDKGNMREAERQTGRHLVAGLKGVLGCCTE